VKAVRVGLAAAAAALCFGAAAAEAQPSALDAPHPIASPYYGDTLFDFYQDKTFSALTGLMVSQHFGRVAPHDEEAEVLRGGMLLSYGLHREATALFTRLIETHAAPGVRDRAWYFLARMRHQRGLDTDAEAALARIAAPLPGALEDDRQLLLAQLLMARADHAGAAVVLQGLQGSPGAGLYARFNLGVALIKAGDAVHGQALLDAVGQSPAADEELRSLRDRANVALGFAALQAGEPRQARAALQRVRLNGLQSNKALLAYGWAAAELNDPQQALVPWTELAGRSDGDAAALEARIAVPYALGELGAWGAALRGYEDAADGYAREQTALNESIAAIRAGKLVAGLVRRNPSEGLAAFAGITALPEMPHAAHLLPILAGNEFQEGFKNLRDLQFLDGNLQQWQDKLGVYGDMLDNRERAFAQRLPAVRASRGPAELAALQQRRDALAAEIARAEQQGDALAYANPRERDLLLRMGHALGTLSRAGHVVDLSQAGERLRRVAGALTWQRSQDFPSRSWEARKSLRAVDAALADARQRDAALAGAQKAEPARHERFAERLARLDARLRALQPVLAALDHEQQQQLQDIAVAELERQQERLVTYTAQARLAIAQIQDGAKFARRSEGGGPP
jgi:hypothetical protein